MRFAFRRCRPCCFRLVLLFMFTTIQSFDLIVSVSCLAVRSFSSSSTSATRNGIIRISQHVWRQAASQHRQRIRELVEPGILSISDDDHAKRNAGHRRRGGGISSNSQSESSSDDEEYSWVTSLDPKNPVYNFLIEYYGIKGTKGVRRLLRWSPCPSLLLLQQEQADTKGTYTIDTIEDLAKLSSVNESSSPPLMGTPSEPTYHGILLEGATESDFGNILHLRGATVVGSTGSDDDDNNSNNMSSEAIGEERGILYSPSLFYGKYDDSKQDENARLATPFIWYQSILQQTLDAEPILHCFGLHEWAMQYQPIGAIEPPSAKYQRHLPLRVSRSIINETVERRGISCTHVDALRFFAPAAAPLNHHGSSLQRTDQLRLEQPGCVHAHMDLLKIALKLQPFVNPVLLQNVLQYSLKARRLDVAASPYDASSYGVGIVPVETPKGRAEYKKQQIQLMQQVQPIRQDLLHAYNIFLSLAFRDTIIGKATNEPQPERYAKAEPGGLPWRKNLVTTTNTK